MFYNMQLFKKKICNYYALMQIIFIKGISISVIFYCFPINKYVLIIAYFVCAKNLSTNQKSINN